MEWDRRLLQGFRAGEPQALAAVFRQHSAALLGRLRGAAWRSPAFASLRSPSELESVLLEVFARAFEPRAREVYDGLRPYELFLMGIARNVLRELARNREDPVSAETVELALQQEVGAGADSAEQEHEDRELEALMVRFREGLAAGDARLFALRFDDGLAQEEVAVRLSLTRIQLRRRELALKKRLLAFLKGHGYLSSMESTGWGFRRAGGT
jgi:RNA polymerase sigma-70 factor (ECF subfamily)